MKKKLLALFLCCALSFGLVTAALITPAAADSELPCLQRRMGSLWIQFRAS